MQFLLLFTTLKVFKVMGKRLNIHADIQKLLGARIDLLAKTKRIEDPEYDPEFHDDHLQAEWDRLRNQCGWERNGGNS